MSETTENVDSSYNDDDRALAHDDRVLADADRVMSEDTRQRQIDDRRVNRDSLALVASSISELNDTMAQLLDRLPAVEAKADSTSRRVNVMSVFLVILILIGITNIYNGLVLRGQGDLAKHQQDDITALAEQINSIVGANQTSIDVATAKILAELHEQNRQQMIVNCALLRSNGVDTKTIPPCEGL